MIDEIRNTLRDAGVRFVRILWCDNANVIRAKAVHIDFEPGMRRGVGISAGQQALPVTADAVVFASGLGPVGEVQLEPDWDTLAVLPWAPGHAHVIGDMRVDGAPWAHCPRDFLRRQIARLAERGLALQAAFENEFMLLRRTADGAVPADRTVFAMTHAMNAHRAFVLELTDALEAQGLTVESYYPESAPGQQELSIRHADGLAAADRQIAFRETVRGVAPRHDLIASFLPKILEGSAGSGCHLNLSLWRGAANVTGDAAHPTGLTADARGFIAGVLHHLNALSALTLPSRNSFRRILPHYWAGAFSAWGYGNREAAVRVTRDEAGGGASRFELKSADAAANPYLALGGVIAAGLDGIERDLPLPDETTVDPGTLSDAARAANRTAPLPADFGEALACLEGNGVLLDALGAERARAYLAVKRAEWDVLADATLEREVELLLERY